MHFPGTPQGVTVIQDKANFHLCETGACLQTQRNSQTPRNAQRKLDGAERRMVTEGEVPSAPKVLTIHQGQQFTM